MRVTSNRLCLLVSAWMVLTANQTFWRLLSHERLANGSGWAFAASVAVASIGLHLFLVRILGPGRTARWSCSLLLAVAATAGWFIDTYGIAIDGAMLRNVLQTDSSEANDFFGASLLWRVGWQAALPIALIFWRVRLPETSWMRSLRDTAVGAIAGIAMLLAAGLPMYSHYASFFRNHDGARYLVTPANVVIGSATLARKALRGHQPFVHAGLDARRLALAGRKPLVVVMVVGETARAASFSLGGYARDTNPRLQKQVGLFYFRDTSSCGTATAVSLPCMFSDLPRKEFELAKADHRDNVLDVLQRSGVAVSWIDNQSGCKGVCVRLPTRDARDSAPAACDADGCLDEALVPALGGALREVRKDSLIVLHAMGSHGPAYHRRVPPDAAVFQPTCPTERIETCSREQIVNAYDNTIAYTDRVLSALIDELQAHRDEVQPVLLYVSDHGESLGENGLYLHAQPYLIAPAVQKKVPMLLWFSRDAAARLELEENCLRGRLGSPVSHDNVSHTLLGLMDVRTAIYRPTLDLLRDCRGRPASDRRPT